MASDQSLDVQPRMYVHIKVLTVHIKAHMTRGGRQDRARSKSYPFSQIPLRNSKTTLNANLDSLIL